MLTQDVAARRQGRVFSLACLLCVLPVLLAVYPPMVDIPQHAAQISAIGAMLTGGDWSFSSMFVLKPFTPYWLGYGLVLVVSSVVSIVWAVKLVVATAVSLFVWAAARFCNRMGMDRTWNWMLLMLPFGFAYQWGFLNFLVAAPFGFLFLCALVDLDGRSDWRACARIALWLHFLFFAHVLTTAFFCMIGMLLVARRRDGMLEWLRRCLPVFTILPLAALWLWTSLESSPAASGPTQWDLGTHRLGALLPSLVSSPPPSWWSGQLVGLFVLAVPFLSGATPTRSWLAWAPFGLYLAWMLFFPNWLGGTAFVYQRFGIFGLPLYLIAFEKRSETSVPHYMPTLRIGVVVMALAMIGWQSIRAISFNSEVAQYREVIAYAEPGKRMLMLAFDPVSRAVAGAQMVHFGSWYQAEQGGLTEFNFARNWVQPLQYRDGVDSTIQQGFEWTPGAFDWNMHRGELYDYFLIRHPSDASQWLDETSGGRVRQIARSGEWQLYAGE